MNIIELMDANAAKHPDKIALCSMDTAFTFREVKEKSSPRPINPTGSTRSTA